MKYSINNYVQAFTESLKESFDDHGSVAAHFIKLLEKTGDIRYSKKIINAIHKKLVNSKGGKWVTIETAREFTEARLKSLKDNFSDKDHVDLKINPELVAGVRITLNEDEELNNSLQNKLNKLFR